MQYLMLDIFFPHIVLLYTVSQILSKSFHHRISFLLPILSFLDSHDIVFFEDSNLSAALKTVAPFLINILWHCWH